MALTYNIAERDIDIRGTLHLKTGVDVVLSAANVVSYTIDERSASSGFSLGEAQSAGFDLVIDDTAHAITPVNVNGASVQMEIGIKSGASYVYSPFGFWYVESSVLSKQSAIATLKGSDALASKFDAVWSDAKGSYPRTLGALATAVCSGTGVTLKSATFLNSGVNISSRPKWPSGTTRRGVIGYIAACAGGFARIDRSGQLEFIAYNAASVGAVDSNTYRSLETGTGARFDFNCVGVRPVGKDAFTRYAIDTGRADTAASTLQVDENPLCTATIANAVKTALTGFASDGIVLDWVGDPSVQPGDLLTVEDTDETEYLLVVNGQTITFDGGLSAVTRAELATETASSSGYAVNDSVLTAKGFLNGRKLSIESVQTDALAAKVITAEKMEAGSITAENAALAEASVKKANIETATIESLVADSVEAVKGKFEQIVTGSLTTDEMYAALANIVVLMVEQITAETISTDALYAELARIVTLRVQEITADNIETDTLYAALANVIVLRAEQAQLGSAEVDDLRAALAEIVRLDAKFADIDYAKIKDLIAEEAIFSNGTAGQLYINRLAVTQANLLNATINRLIMPGGDGKYYAVVVGSDGVLHTEEVTVTAGEIAAGELGDGRQISATTINAGSINGSTINAQSGVINTILTTALTAGKITAGEALISSATIPALYVTAINAIGNAMTLTANESINLLVRSGSVRRLASLPSGPVEGEAIIYTGAQPHEALQWTGKGINPTQRTYAAVKTGAAVSFEDLSDQHALKVTVKTVAAQAGSGTPSPANIRAINGKAQVGVTVNEAEHVLTPLSALYGLPGAMDDISNDGRETHRTYYYEMTGAEAIVSAGLNAGVTGVFRFRLPDGYPLPIDPTSNGVVGNVISSHFQARNANDTYSGIVGVSISTSPIRYQITVPLSAIGATDADTDATKLSKTKTWLAAERNAGQPVRVLYQLAAPTTAIKTATTINGADGANAVTSDGASMTVEYTASGWKRLNNSIIGSGIEITPDHIRAWSDRFSVGNDSNPGNDALVIEDNTVYSPSIESPSVMPTYAGPTNITIKPDATEEEMEAGTAFRTLAQLATVINRKWLVSSVTATVDAALNEFGDIIFNGITGASLTIIGAGTYTGPSDSMPRHTGMLGVWDCTAAITFRNMRLVYALSPGRPTLLTLQRATYVNVLVCVLEDTGVGGGALVHADFGSRAYVRLCALANATGAVSTAIVSQRGSVVTVDALVGDLSATTVLMGVWGGGMIAWSGSAPVCANATLVANANFGWAQYSISSRVPYRGTQGGGTTAPVSVDLTPTLAKAYLSNDGWGGALYQGYTPNKGQCTTCYWFDVSALAGKTILSASLTLHRYSGYGKNAGVPVRIHPINNAAASGGLSRGAFIAQIGTVSAGATREMELPISVVQALVAGTYKAIGLYTGETKPRSDRDYSENYGRWYGDAVLSVTYQ